MNLQEALDIVESELIKKDTNLGNLIDYGMNVYEFEQLVDDSPYIKLVNHSIETEGCEKIYEINKGGEFAYIKLSGSYDSWNGPSWSDHFVLVTPVSKIITIYKEI